MTQNEKPGGYDSATGFIKNVVNDFNNLHPSTEMVIGIGISLMSSLILGLPLNVLGLIFVGHAYYKKVSSR